jgi:predicted patatin/cPLA2 family phospholipase
METNKVIQMHKEIEPYSIQINKYITSHIEKLDNPRKLINNIYDILKKYECEDKELIECIEKILQKNPDKKITKPTLGKLFSRIVENYSASVSNEEYEKEGMMHYLKK